MSELRNIEIHPDPDIRVQPIDADNNCVIVDDFLKDPQAIVEFACANAADFELQDRGYPGLLYDVHSSAMSDIYRFIRLRMSSQFSFFKGDIRTSTYLSMATKQPGELSNLQRLCHTDPRERADRRNYAGLVYLFDNEELGGTGFYRWKEQDLITEATALEQTDPGRALEFLRRHFPTYNRPACYMTDTNEIAELLYEVPARFNRLIFYSGDLPHSARISKPERLSKDFSRGRLTLNCFASTRPK